MSKYDFTDQVMYGITDDMTPIQREIQLAKNKYTQLFGNREYVDFIFSEIIKDTYDGANRLYYEEMFEKKFKCIIRYTDLEWIQLYVVMKLNRGEWYRRTYKVAIDGNLDNFIQLIGRMNNYYMNNIDKKDIDEVIQTVKEFYNSKNYRLFLKDRNYLRYAFREFGDFLVKKHGIDSNRMLKVSDVITRSFMSNYNYELALEELIRLGVIRNFASTHKNRNAYGSVTGTSSRINIGFTDYGWKLYKTQLNK